MVLKDEASDEVIAYSEVPLRLHALLFFCHLDALPGSENSTARPLADIQLPTGPRNPAQLSGFAPLTSV